MKRNGMRLVLAVLLSTLFASVLPAAKTLDVYTIDVEGGKSVLIVSPSGETMLFDAGWPALGSRQSSVDRIVEACKAAGVKQIDELVISHFDIDHIGDVPQLASKIPIRHIFDHGEFQPAPAPAVPNARYTASKEAAEQRFKAYDEMRRKVGHTVLKPGDKLPFKGVSVQVVAAGGKFIQKPVSGGGAPNPLCATTQQAALIDRDVEDNQSVGLLFIFGKFRMLDLADLEANRSRSLVCPENLIGTVNVYQVNVHGQFKGIAPELIGAIHPQVAIMGNGARKGADPPTWPILRATPGLEDIWQVHYSAAGTKETNPPDNFIANLAPSDEGKLIKLLAKRDGSFIIVNSRNGFSKTYKATFK
jgi:beta-lactamase superfamily II metal-dependent hydrolase